MISHLGAMISVVVGKLMAKRMKGEKGFVGLTTIGEGGMQTGATHEGMNIAAVERVPLVMVATNNHFAYSTPNDREFACADLVDRAQGYGYEGSSVDGTDLAHCLEVIGAAIKRARAGASTAAGRRLDVCASPAMGNTTMPAMSATEIRREPFAQDSLLRAEQLILEQGLLDARRVAEMRAELAAEVDEAVATAQQEDAPVGSEEDWCAISTRDLTDEPTLAE